ncbi:MAG TPA: hypothetical protein VML54_15335 [Candidatus Limnocylindrales bacterium]|nr:hypothetical protein [Candidatus Limnocylindrales bacterium]
MSPAALLYLVGDGPEIARRRPLVPRGQLVEVWADLYTPGQFWIGSASKRLLDAADDTPLASVREVRGEDVPIYYGPRDADAESLPLEESLRGRVLSGRGIAVACITIDDLGERRRHEPASPRDPIFYLRRPGGSAAHLWRLFRTKDEAKAYQGEFYGHDPKAREWASTLPWESYDDLVQRS